MSTRLSTESDSVMKNYPIFTAERVSRLLKKTPGDGILYDGALPGFGIRVQGDRMTWVIAGRIPGGRTFRKKVGDLPAMDLPTARRHAKKMLATVALGQDPHKERRAAVKAKARAQHNALTIVLERFLDQRAIKEATGRKYVAVLELCCDDWMDRDVFTLKGDDIAPRYVRICKGRGVGTGNLWASTLRSVLNFAIAEADPDGTEGLVNPFVALTRRKLWRKLTPRTRHLDTDTLGSFWRSLDVLSDTFRDAYRLMILTGLRRNECLGLQAGDIDLKKCLLTLPGERTKNGRQHTLPLGPYALAMLKPRVEAGGFLFPADSDSGHATTTKRASEKLQEYNGYQISPHDLRRTFATVLELTGAPELAIKKLMNHHDSRNVTASYTQIGAERLRPIMEQVESHVLTLAKEAKE